MSPTTTLNGLPQLADVTREAFGFTWTDTFTPRAAGVYTFTVEADDVASLSIAGASVYTSWWTCRALDPQSVSVGLKAGVAEGLPTETTIFGYSSDLAPIDFRPVSRMSYANELLLLEETFTDVANADGTTTRTHTRTVAGTTRTSYEVFDALGRTILVVAEDGRATRTVYAELVDGGWTATEDAGVADESGFALVPGRSTREVRRYNAQGNVTHRERYARVDESWHLLDSSEMSYDAAHRKTATTFSDGTTEGAGWIDNAMVPSVISY